MEDASNLTVNVSSNHTKCFKSDGVCTSSSAISKVKGHVVLQMPFSTGNLIFMSNTYLKSKMTNAHLPWNNVHKDNEKWRIPRCENIARLASLPPWLLWRVANRSSSGMYQMENIWRTMLECRDHSVPMIWCLLDRLSARTFTRSGMCCTYSVIPCCWQTGGCPMLGETWTMSECLPDSVGRHLLSCCTSGTSLPCLWSEEEVDDRGHWVWDPRCSTYWLLGLTNKPNSRTRDWKASP